MATSPLSPPIGLLVSGGLDSGILLGHLLAAGRTVQPFYVRGSLRWEPAELATLRLLLAALARPGLAELVVLDMPVADLYRDHWSVTGRGVPDETTPDEAVFLPGRNALVILKPALWCQMHGIEELALAPLVTNPFPDATATFFDLFERTLSQAAQPPDGVARPLRIVRPFGHLHKREVMQLGRSLPLELTFSCIDPVAGAQGEASLHCGRCNKCAERKAAFKDAGLDDPTRYA
ncbi:MAG: 7-cyano-7-deazaguanine synthase [Pirellulales bacterium]|nr:7-cyano-7-deazaguanine synthase [Pirellulales bacterium]